MTKVTVTAVLTFPAASCWVTDAVWVPSASVGEVQVQLPPADTVAWQRGDPDRVTETTAPGSPRPENTGRDTSPSSSLSSSSSLPEHTEEVPVRVGDESLVGEGVWSMVGAARPWVRTTKSIPCEVNPAASIRAVQVYPPSASCCVQDQV